jgi:glycosyltransferase involved in cell wall biosynthesis
MTLSTSNTRNALFQTTPVERASDPDVKHLVVGSDFQERRGYSGYSEQPKLLIASRIFCASGQPWLHRQVVGVRGFKKELLCWERQNPVTQPVEDVLLHILPEDPAPYDGARRWWHRARNLRGRNFYAAVGREKRQLAELLRRNRPDVILCYFGDIAMRILPVAQRADVPVVAYLHGDFQFLLNRWYRWSLARVVQQFAAVVVINPIEREWMLSHGVPEDKVHLIPCGAPTDVFRPRARRSEGPIRFVMVSRLSPAKGCEWSIRAFARVAEELSDSELHIYGDGPLRQQLQWMVGQLGLASRVLFHGWIDEARLAEALPQYDIFLQHSLDKEGFGVSIVEAEACELPVVVTRVRGIMAHVVADETGLFVPEKDVPAMASAMLRLARSPELRQQLGECGRRRAVRLYDSTLLTQRLERVLLGVSENNVTHIV